MRSPTNFNYTRWVADTCFFRVIRERTCGDDDDEEWEEEQEDNDDEAVLNVEFRKKNDSFFSWCRGTDAC